MGLLLSALWPALAAALVLGICIGALSGLPRTRGDRVLAALPVLALAALAGLALAGLVPGRAGVWVESAVLLLGAYLAGCTAGGLARRRRP